MSQLIRHWNVPLNTFGLKPAKTGCNAIFTLKPLSALYLFFVQKKKNYTLLKKFTDKWKNSKKKSLEIINKI